MDISIIYNLVLFILCLNMECIRVYDGYIAFDTIDIDKDGQIYFYSLDNDLSNTINKQEYVSYIINKEWINHDLDQDDFIDFNEFKQEFFKSTFYSSLTKIGWSMIEETTNNELNSIMQNLYNTTSDDIHNLNVTMIPHSFDTEIQEYISSNTNINDFDPFESILYPSPLNLVDQVYIIASRSNRRRLADCRSKGKDDCEEDFSCGWNENADAWKCDFKNLDCDAAKNEKDCEDIAECDWDRDAISGEWTCQDDCFSDDQSVTILDPNTGNALSKYIQNVSIGDYIFDGQDYTKVIYVKKRSEKIKMIKLDLIDVNDSNIKTNITLTDDHLLYDQNMQLVRPDMIKIGDILQNNYMVIDITNNIYLITLRNIIN